MKRRRMHTRAEQDQEIERLGRELQEIKAENSRETWHWITTWIVIPVACLIVLGVYLYLTG